MHPDELAEATDWILQQCDTFADPKLIRPLRYARAKMAARFASDIDPKLLRPLRYARRLAVPEVAHAAVFARERRAAIRRAVAILTPRERFVLRLRHRDGDPLTYRVIGRWLGVTSTTVREIHLRALFRLRFMRAGLHAFAEQPTAQVKAAWLAHYRGETRAEAIPEAR